MKQIKEFHKLLLFHKLLYAMHRTIWWKWNMNFASKTTWWNVVKLPCNLINNLSALKLTSIQTHWKIYLSKKVLGEIKWTTTKFWYLHPSRSFNRCFGTNSHKPIYVKKEEIKKVTLLNKRLEEKMLKFIKKKPLKKFKVFLFLCFHIHSFFKPF